MEFSIFGLLSNASPYELGWTLGALMTFYMCLRSLNYQRHDHIKTDGRPLSPSEWFAVTRYHRVRVWREAANCYTQFAIVMVGIWLMSRPPAVGYTNDHPSPGSLVLAACFSTIEIATMLSAIMTERLRTTLAFLEQRGVVSLYGYLSSDDRTEHIDPDHPYRGPERRQPATSEQEQS